MEQKGYNIRFYQGTAYDSNGKSHKVSDILTKLVNHVQANQVPAPVASGDNEFEVRDISESGGFFSGVLAVLRPDAPHIRDSAGGERPIPLNDGDRLMEKNHFIYYAENELLAWQVNGRGSHVSRLEKYLTAFSGLTVTLDDMLKIDAWQRLSNGIISRVEFRLAQPRNPALIDSANWESAAFEMMSGSDATTVSVSVSTKRKNRGLSAKMKEAVRRLMDGDTTRKLKVKLREIDDPVDLLTECLRTRITVDMDGLYPKDSRQVFAEMATAKRELQPEFDRHFGAPGNALV
jgi:hypothetical protein